MMIRLCPAWGLLFLTVPALSADLEIGCSWCGNPDVDHQRYINVAYNAWFVHGSRWHSSTGGTMRAQVLVRGASGFQGPEKDWALVQFEYAWTTIQAGFDLFFGRVGYSGPVVVTNIKVTAQTRSGKQFTSELLPNSPALAWHPDELPYPAGAVPETEPGPIYVGPIGGGGRDSRQPTPPTLSPDWFCVFTEPGRVACHMRELDP